MIIMWLNKKYEEQLFTETRTKNIKDYEKQIEQHQNKTEESKNDFIESDIFYDMHSFWATWRITMLKDAIKQNKTKKDITQLKEGLKHYTFDELDQILNIQKILPSMLKWSDDIQELIKIEYKRR